uniref:Uncharacterized protein n=1 Tax=Setaria italica TaxID=4555 RepID=K3ZYY3_SETIT
MGLISKGLAHIRARVACCSSRPTSPSASWAQIEVPLALSHKTPLCICLTLGNWKGI